MSSPGSSSGAGNGGGDPNRPNVQAPLAIHAPRPTVANPLAGPPAFSFAQAIQAPATPPLHFGLAANTPPPSFTTPRGQFSLDTPPLTSSPSSSSSGSLAAASNIPVNQQPFHYVHQQHVPTSPLSKQPTNAAQSDVPTPFFSFGALPLSQPSSSSAKLSTTSTPSFTFRFDTPPSTSSTNPLRDRLHKRRGHAPAPLRTKLANSTSIPSPLSSANSDLHFNPYPHASPRGRLHSPAAPLMRDHSASPSPAAMAAAMAAAQARAGALPLQEALAARVPHEILLRIFGYLMPESGLVNPMFDDVPASPPRVKSKVATGLRTRSPGGSVRMVSSDDEDEVMFDQDGMDTDDDDDDDSGAVSPNSDGMEGVEATGSRPGSSLSGSVIPGFNFLRNFVGSSSPPASSSSLSSSSSDARPKTAPASSSGPLGFPRRLINPFTRSSLTRSASTPPAAATNAAPVAEPTVVPRPARIRPYYRNIHPCLRVCRAWYYAAVEYVHGEPVLENVLDFLAWLESLEATVGQMKSIPPPSLLAMPAESDEEEGGMGDAEMVDVSDEEEDKEQDDDEDGMDVDMSEGDRATTPTPRSVLTGAHVVSPTRTPQGKGASMEQLSFGNVTAATSSTVYPAISSTSTASPADKRQANAFMVGSNEALPAAPARIASKRASADVLMGGGTNSPPSGLSTAASLEYLAQSAMEREQQHLASLRGRPGFAGFAQTRTLRFERSNHIQTRYMSYRTLVKGSLPSPNQFIRDDHLNRIADAFQLLQPRVTTLDLRNCANVTDVAIIHLITAVSAKLRHLNVTNCRHIKDVTVRTIARVCDHLEELVLRGCGKVGDASIREVATYLGPQLKLLDVSGCMRINDPGLDYLAKFSGNYQLIHWEALRLEAAMRPISPAIQSPLPLDTPTTPMAARAASPVYGRPQSPVSPPSSPRPGSPTQQYAQKGVVPRTDGRVGGKLRTLCLPGIRRQSRGGLVVFLTEMASIHPHVHTLEFSIPPPPSTSTKSMFSGGPALFWGLRGLTLTSLTIRDCEYLDDSNLVPIAHYCKQLRSLTLFNAQHMTETAFGTLVSELRHLKVLVTRGAKTLRDSAIQHVIQAECAPHLIRLDLSDTSEFTDEAMYQLASVVVHEGPVATAVPTTLTVMTPRMPANVTPVLRSLQHLAMENCRRITFRGVMAVARILVPYDPKVPPPLAQAQPAATSVGVDAAGNPVPGAFNNGPPGPPTSLPPTGPLPAAPAGTSSSTSVSVAGSSTPAVPKDPLADQASCLAYRTLVRTRGRSLVSLHVSGAWEGVVTKATVAYRERHRDPQVTRDIHMASFAVRGLMRDEFDLGTVGSGGSPMLWSIMPATARPNAIWYCRFVRSALRNLLDEYSWIPVPVKVFSVIPAPVSASAASPPGSP